jgi:hypothetical protein
MHGVDLNDKLIESSTNINSGEAIARDYWCKLL